MEGHFYYWNDPGKSNRSLLIWGNSPIADSFDVSPLPEGYLVICQVSEQPFEFDSMMIRDRSDSSGYLRISHAAPPGKYKIIIHAGKEGFYPAEIVVVDPPGNQDQIHHVNILLVPLED